MERLFKKYSDALLELYSLYKFDILKFEFKKNYLFCKFEKFGAQHSLEFWSGYGATFN